MDESLTIYEAELSSGNLQNDTEEDQLELEEEDEEPLEVRKEREKTERDLRTERFFQDCRRLAPSSPSVTSTSSSSLLSSFSDFSEIDDEVWKEEPYHYDGRSTSSLPNGASSCLPKKGRRQEKIRRKPSNSSISKLSLIVPTAVPMSVDTLEDVWTRLHDIRINGNMLEYVGRGKNIHDNGLAQANIPLTPLNHYFELKIIDPGESCYVAIGLARKDYPLHKHPGWNRGSIAFHADDGKIFIGSGVGTPFGPRCEVNDILGCGIVFPLQYGDPPPTNKSSGYKWPWEVGDQDFAPQKTRCRYRRRIRPLMMDNAQDHSSESEDDIWWNNRNQVYDDKVKVFFIRNSKLLGIKDIRIPKGGFYPTIGMLSCHERVMIDLSPLSG